MQYENYIFDLYGTLVDIHTDESKTELWEKLALFYGYYGALYTPEGLKENYARMVEVQEADMHEAHPEIQIESVFSALFRQKGIEPDSTLAVHAGQFFRILSTDYLRLYEGVPGMLSALRESGKRIYLLSNAQRIFTEYEMHTLEIAKYFDDIFISSEYGVKKPEPRFFQMLIDKHGLDVSRSIMIGNDGKSDISGAKSVGLATLYIHSNISPLLKKREIRDTSGRLRTEYIYPEADFVLPEMNMKRVIAILLAEKRTLHYNAKPLE